MIAKIKYAADDLRAEARNRFERGDQCGLDHDAAGKARFHRRGEELNRRAEELETLLPEEERG